VFHRTRLGVPEDHGPAAHALRRFLLYALGVLPCLLTPATASAQIVPCTGVSTSQDYKLLLDDFAIGSADDPDLKLFMEALKASLALNLAHLEADGLGSVQLVRCQNRKPQERDFDPGVVRQLNARRVILEMWGIGKAGGDPGDYRAFVTYFMIPVRHSGPQDPATFTIERRGRSDSPLDTLMEAVSQATELKAYVAVGMGTKFLQEGQYDLARKSLCRAETWLADAGTVTAPAPFVAWVRNLSAAVVRQALDDPQYSGALRLLSGHATPPCLR
jgi:hypothetical protein